MFRKFSKRPAQNLEQKFPAPVKGLVTATSLLDLPRDACSELVNFIAYPDRIETRPGYSSFSTGYTNPVERLHVYSGVNGVQSLWATTDTGIYNAVAGAVGAAAIAITNGKTISTAIATGAGSYLLVANGVDTIKQYDGASWTSIATFGATATSEYSYVETYRQRVYLLRKNSLNLEYLPVNSIAGATTQFNMGSIFRQGGKLVAMATWTVDGGIGPEDLLAIVSSSGEVGVFSGSDPATWALRGVYFLGKPIGDQCLYKFGGDLLFLCELGVVPLSQALQGTVIERTTIVTRRIQTLFNTALGAGGNLDGWQIISQPTIPLLLINIPSLGPTQQFVMNTQSGAWSIFQGWAATCWARLGTTLYFGTVNSVCAVNAANDNGAQITASLTQAPTNMGMMWEKMLKLVKPYFLSNGGFSYDAGVSSDLQAPEEYTTLQPVLANGVSLWGTAVWGTNLWNALTTLTQAWETFPDNFGTWKALRITVRTTGTVVKYYGADTIFVRGGRL
jgi:hypothetical protein